MTGEQLKSESLSERYRKWFHSCEGDKGPSLRDTGPLALIPLDYPLGGNSHHQTPSLHIRSFRLWQAQISASPLDRNCSDCFARMLVIARDFPFWYS
jgi:hypothetical protein